MVVNRFDVYLTNLDSNVGSEIQNRTTNILDFLSRCNYNVCTF